MDGLSWFFKLIDQVTGPAKAIQAATAGVAGAFVKTDDTIAKTTKSAEGRVTEMAVAIGGWLQDAGEKALEFTKDFLKMGPELAIAGAKFAADSADFKRNTLFSLQTMLGATGDAHKTLEDIERYATQTGLSKDDFTKFATRALGAGFSQDELKPILGAVSDIRAANGGDAGAGEALFAALQSMKDNAKKGISGRELASLGSLGISPDKIYSVIAAQRNMTLAQAKALADSGGVKGQDALVAVLKTVQGMNAGGKLGGLGQDFQAGSITAQLQHVKDAFGDIFENVDIKPLTDFLQKLNTGLQGDGIEKISGIINDMFSQLVGWLSKVSLDDIIDGFWTVADVMQKVWNFGVAVVEVGKAWGSAWGSAFGAFMPAIEKMGGFFTGPDGKGTIDWLGGTIETVKILGEIAGGTFGFMVLVVETFAVAIVKTYQGIVSAVDGIKAAFNGLASIGQSLVDGIWSGLAAGWTAMMTKFHGLIELLPASVKKILGIASPSKVFEGLGMQTAAGFGVGFDREDLAGGMSDAMNPPSSGIAPGSFGAASGYRGNSAPVTVTVEINITDAGSKKSEEIVNEVRRILLPELTDAFEQLAIEFGGA